MEKRDSLEGWVLAQQKESVKRYRRLYYIAHRAERLKYASEYQKKNKKKINERVRSWVLRNLNKVAGYARKYRATHREKHLAARRKYYSKNKEQAYKLHLKYYKKNSEKIKAYGNAYFHNLSKKEKLERNRMARLNYHKRMAAKRK